jgi:hypothetical protein
MFELVVSAGSDEENSSSDDQSGESGHHLKGQIDGRNDDKYRSRLGNTDW